MSDAETINTGRRDAERGIRDLMGLVALSALWQGKDGITVLEQMLEAVERLVSIEFAYAESTVLPDEPSISRVRVNMVFVTGQSLQLWRAAAGSWPKNASVSTSVIVPKATPIGELKIVRMELGANALHGGVWFGSNRADFPTTTEFSILRAAASLAATSIQAARIQHERDQSYKAKDEFLAMLGHELRNPLAPIRTGASLLLAEGVTLPQVKKTATVLERQISHMTGLVDSLLDVSRLSTGAVLLAEELVDMKEVVRDATEQIASLMQSKSHVVTMHITAEHAYVFGDRNRLVQVVANLLNNACKYTPEGGTISVLLAVAPDEVRLSVTDNGIGIEAAMLRKVFELFSQAKRSVDRFGGGLGVGLALAKQLIDLHGGRLTADSAGLGHGASFNISLRRMDAPSATLQAAGASGGGTRPLKIFVVDDNADAADLIGEMLTMSGHTVVLANHPQELLSRAHDVQADVYLLDIGLPDIDGYELARRLTALPGLGSFTLIALTGYGQMEDQKLAYDAGFNFHCVKPVDIENLNAILSEVSTHVDCRPN